jgi:hypothetical protein
MAPFLKSRILFFEARTAAMPHLCGGADVEHRAGHGRFGVERRSYGANQENGVRPVTQRAPQTTRSKAPQSSRRCSSRRLCLRIASTPYPHATVHAPAAESGSTRSVALLRWRLRRRGDGECACQPPIRLDVQTAGRRVRRVSAGRYLTPSISPGSRSIHSRSAARCAAWL